MNVLSIGGSDPSSGAGIQSDIKTFENHGVYGFTVITAITSQNTKKISKILPISSKIIKSQLESWFEEKVPKAGDCLKSLDDLIKHLEYKTDYDEYNFLYAVKEKMMAANFTLYISYYTRFFEEDDMNVFYDNYFFSQVIYKKSYSICMPPFT